MMRNRNFFSLPLSLSLSIFFLFPRLQFCSSQTFSRESTRHGTWKTDEEDWRALVHFIGAQIACKLCNHRFRVFFSRFFFSFFFFLPSVYRIECSCFCGRREFVLHIHHIFVHYFVLILILIRIVVEGIFVEKKFHCSVCLLISSSLCAIPFWLLCHCVIVVAASCLYFYVCG